MDGNESYHRLSDVGSRPDSSSLLNNSDLEISWLCLNPWYGLDDWPRDTLEHIIDERTSLPKHLRLLPSLLDFVATEGGSSPCCQARIISLLYVSPSVLDSNSCSPVAGVREKIKTAFLEKAIEADVE